MGLGIRARVGARVGVGVRVALMCQRPTPKKMKLPIQPTA